MIREAIEKIQELCTPPTFTDSEGVERQSSNCQALALTKLPSMFGVSLESACMIAINELQDGEFVIIECSFGNVFVRIRQEYNEKISNVLVFECKPILPRDFHFGQFMQPEEFIISASDFFQRNDNYNAMIALVSSITDVAETIVDDDGLSQTITFKNKIGRKESGQLDPFMKLRAYRTFREIEQPEAEYLLRFRKGSNGPLVALFEASGYSWKIEATEAVYQYVKSHVSEDIMVLR